MADKEKILQILLAIGWYATYTDDAENDALDPVVCFALVEMQQDGESWQEVRPMGTDAKSIDLIDTADNFKTVIYKPNYTGREA